MSSREQEETETEGDIPDIGSECYSASPILERKYQKVTASEVASKQEHLSESERTKLEDMLSNSEEVFDGKLGCYPHQKVHLKRIGPLRWIVSVCTVGGIVFKGVSYSTVQWSSAVTSVFNNILYIYTLLNTF